MMTSPIPNNLTQFQQMLDTSKDKGRLDVSQIETARKALGALPVADQERALDFLEHHIATYATPEAKANYSLNPELNLKDVISALVPAKVPDWLQTRMQKDVLINLTELETLQPAERKQFLELAGEARDYYGNLASKMRSGSNYATANFAALEDFITRAQQQSDAS